MSEFEFGPRFREAYPSLNIVNAKAALGRGKPVCDFVDHQGVTRGVARLEITNELCTVEWNFNFPQTGHRSGRRDLAIARANNGFGEHRLMVLCPGCRDKKVTVFFREDWACATCLGLLFRSQLVDPAVRKWAEFDKIKERVGYGRPKGMHNKTYNSLKTKHDKIQKQLYDQERANASIKYVHVINNNWRPWIATDVKAFRNITTLPGISDVGNSNEIDARVPSRVLRSESDVFHSMFAGLEKEESDYY